ncbi:MAG: STAS domain-containing protein [Deltaproteobacteria bacterium]|nr:STAS domain-containing protein [Deltaproteobacteria bacterium]
MIEFTITEAFGIKWLAIKGRIDSMTCGEIQQQIDDLISDGNRTIVTNLEGVHYISSAGLRVFLLEQKKLRKVGGEIVLYKTAKNIFGVFEMSGLSELFRFISSREEIEADFHADIRSPLILSKEINGIICQYIKKEAPPGDLVIIGSHDNLPISQYTKDDVVRVQANNIQFGCGLATLGDVFEEYKHLFGEAVVIDRNLFFYPAVKLPVADFMLCPKEDSLLEYPFLNGFAFNGPYHRVVSFESREGFVELNNLVNALFELSDANMLGIVVLAESKGLWGMNIKKVPIIENGPKNGKQIFDEENFIDWMNFPMEPAEVNNILAGVGIAIRDMESIGPDIQEQIAQGFNFHMHGGVFSSAPLSKQLDHFENELERIMAELEIYKVQHLLGQSRLGSGMVGIVEVEG